MCTAVYSPTPFNQHAAPACRHGYGVFVVPPADGTRTPHWSKVRCWPCSCGAVFALAGCAADSCCCRCGPHHLLCCQQQIPTALSLMPLYDWLWLIDLGERHNGISGPVLWQFLVAPRSLALCFGSSCGGGRRLCHVSLACWVPAMLPYCLRPLAAHVPTGCACRVNLLSRSASVAFLTCALPDHLLIPLNRLQTL